MKKDQRFQGFDEPKFNVNTIGVFKRQFTFPQIALNDYAKEQLESLELEQTAMNQDPDLSSSPSSFLATAKQVAQSLKDRYGEQWINPTSMKQVGSKSKLSQKKSKTKKVIKSKNNINRYKKDLEKQEESKVDIDEIVEASLKDINMEYEQKPEQSAAEDLTFSDIYEKAAEEAEKLPEYEEIVDE